MAVEAEPFAIRDASLELTHPTAVTADLGGPGRQAYLNGGARGGAVGDKVSFTIDRAAKQLTGFDPVTGEPYPGWSGVAGVGYTVTYGFRANAPAVMPSDISGFSTFKAAQIVQAELALQAWADVADIRFVRVGVGTSGEAAYSDSASILFGNYSSGQAGAAAFANYPGDPAFSSASGDVWVNITSSGASQPLLGNFGAFVLIHEIGHAIGLTHPGDYDADGDNTVTYEVHAEYYEDTRQFTVMSYFGEHNTGAAFAGAYPAAPMLDDIAGAQLEYGPNFSTRTGDTVYGFNATADRPWFVALSPSTKLVFAVWDAAGTDTFDFSGYATAQVIDLREGFFSSIGGLVGNVAVAKGAVIENARGGSGPDEINGNAAANTIYGGAGGDTLYGFGGADYLRGEAGDDSIVGGAGFDDLHGNMGDDTILGGETEDWVVGGQGSDRLYGDGGHDVVLGNLGNDTLDGGVGNDVVRGGQGADSVSGGEGWDWLAGDRGDDTISGGPGMDVFHTFSGAGLDLVTDFNPQEGDRVNVLPGDAYGVYQSGADVVIDLGGGDRMVLLAVQLNSLPAGWVFS